MFDLNLDIEGGKNNPAKKDTCGKFHKCLFVIFVIFSLCFGVLDNIGNYPFQLFPFAFNILCELQLATGTDEIVLGVDASEIIVSRDIVIKKS